MGLTIIIFWYFIKGILYSYKNYPKIIVLILLVPILVPAIINGIAGAKSSIYHTTHYIYLMFYFSPVFAAIGLSKQTEKFRSSAVKTVFVSFVILTCIPLSYVKEFVPQKYNKLFPKVIQFIVTTEDPQEARKLISFIDENIKSYPALMFDADGSALVVHESPDDMRTDPDGKSGPRIACGVIVRGG